MADDDSRVIAERLTAQLLAGEPARDAVAVAERLLAIQGQDLRGARLAVRARSTGLSVADVDRASSDRSLLITWVNRGTLHLIRSEDYPWLHALTAPTLLTANARRLEQEGVDPGAAERGVAAIEKALADEGPQTRDQLRERVAATGVPTAGQALLHGPFEPLLLGWTSREPILGSNASVVTSNGIFRPIALARGRAVATWAMPRGEIELKPFGRLRAGDRSALEADAVDVTRFLAG